jgi:hypothetical protein
MNEPIPGCPCGHPDFRVEIDISAVIVVKPEEVALAIEGCSTHARLGDVFCINCDRRTLAHVPHRRVRGGNHEAAADRAIAALEAAHVIVELGL